MDSWKRAADPVLASQAESDDLSEQLGGSISETEPTEDEIVWFTNLKKHSHALGYHAPVNLHELPTLKVISACTGCCAEGAVLKDRR